MKRGKYNRDGEKGISALQRKILECLGEDMFLTIPQLRKQIYIHKIGKMHIMPCPAEVESERVTIHKSLHSLERRGLVSAPYKDKDGCLLWGKTKEEETR